MTSATVKRARVSGKQVRSWLAGHLVTIGYSIVHWERRITANDSISEDS